MPQLSPNQTNILDIIKLHIYFDATRYVDDDFEEFVTVFILTHSSTKCAGLSYSNWTDQGIVDGVPKGESVMAWFDMF